MAEKDEQLGEISDIQTLAPQATEIVLAGNQIVLVDSGPKVHVSKEGEAFKVQVNRQKFSDEHQAVRAATLRVAELTQTRRFIQQDAQAAVRILQDQKSYRNILKLQGLKHLKRDIPSTPIKTGDLSLSDQFLYACEQYVITGKLPPGLNAEVARTFQTLPKSKRRLHALDELISEEYSPKANTKLYGYLEKAYQALKAKEKQETKKFEYKPQIGTPGEQEPIDPNDIESKVSPFFGGYYRGYVCAYDPHQKQIVQKPGQAHPFAPEDLEGEHKEYTYETVFDPTKDKLLEIPYRAVPLVHILEPKSFQILRSETGSFYLALKHGAAEVTSKVPVKFRFVLVQNESNKLNDEPEELSKVLGDFDEAAEAFLQVLEDNKILSDIEKAKRSADYVRKRFKYPKDEAERAQMNDMYLNAEDNLLQTMSGHGVADCYWSNIFHGQMLSRLGIHHRVIAGHHISKDPRFDFAAITGIGHAWGEVWNGEEWLRTDATPAKEKEDEEQEEGEPQEGDFGESAPPEEQDELSPDEIRELFKEMLEQVQEKEDPQSPEKLFEQQTGVTLEKWRTVEAFIKAVNDTPVPAESSIKNHPSTLKEEWDSLFEIIYKRREIPVEAYRGPVRQSEGDELEDPVDAAIDLLAGESDPMGYKIHALRTHEEVFVTEFEDDAILDLTGSMSGTPAEEQKKMILSGLYNLMMLNRRLGLDKYRRKMKDPINLRSHVLSFKGDTLVSALQSSEQEIDEKALAFLYDELGKTQTGGGNLVGALKAYEAAIDGKTDQKVRNGKCVKVLTIVSDGGVNDKPEAVNIITRLRARGIVVQGIGFGNAAQDIRVICHDPGNADAGVVLSDVTQAVLTRHKMLSNSLKKI